MQLKKAWIWLSMILLLCLAPSVAGADGLRGYIKGQGWKFVSLGEYPYEEDGRVKPVLWRMLQLENDQALLLTEYVIDTQQVIFETDEVKIANNDYRRITRYDESDLYTWLNTVAINTMFGNSPERSALIEEPGGGKLFILTSEQFLDPTYGFSASRWGNQTTRHAIGTPYAIEKRGLYVDNSNGKSPYWASTVRAPEMYHLQLIGYNGHLSYGGYTRTNVGLRLSVRVDMTQLTVTGGQGTRKNPFVLVSKSRDPYVLSAEEAALTPRPTATPTPVPTATPTPRPTPTRIPNSDGEVLLSFVGDCSIGDSEQFVTYTDSYHNTVDEKGYDWIFSLVKDYLAEDDLTIANLESVLTTKLAHSSKMYNLKAAPDHVNILTAGSIEMVSTVNNHCMDFYRNGYVDMLEHLDNAGVDHFGSVYTTQPDGFDELAVQEIKGIRIGFVGFSLPQESDKKKIANRVRILKEERDCDLVVVSLHWGENEAQPSAGQVAFAKAAIDAGADVIWGHHPHVIQPIMFYKGKPVMFSTGSFTFGTAFNADPATGIFQLAYEKVNGEVFLTRLQVIPCQTQDGPDYRPFVLTDEEARRSVFKKLRMRNSYAKCVNLPDSFLETGVVWFENGEMLP